MHTNWPRTLAIGIFAMVLRQAPLVAQQDPATGVSRQPDFVTPPVAPVVTIPARQAPSAPPELAGAVREINPKRVYPRPGAEFVPQGPPPPELDPLLAIQEAFGPGGDTRALTTSLNFAGQGFSSVNPPDPVGAVGPSHYVQMINGSDGTRVTIYNKVTGAVVTGPFLLQTLGTGGACADGLGDPIALYDRLAGRWLLSEFASAGNHLCIYVSQTADPAGAYFRYDFPTPQFPDYPKYAVWPNAYYVTTNESSPAIYALDRTLMLNGAAATAQRFTATNLAGFGFQALTPGDFDGSTAPPAGSPGYFARHRDDEVHNSGSNDTTKDFVEIWQLQPNFVTPANSVLSGPTNIGVASFDSSLCGLESFSCFPQPGSVVALDPLREVVMWRLQYRNFGSYATLVGNFAVDVNGSDRGGIRWFELRKTGSAAWTLYQEGTFSPDATNRWMGSIAMDGTGNIALAHSVSSSGVFPGLRFTGRQAGDALGAMTTGETTIVNGAAANASNRWGDYSAMTVDPSDDCTFWFTGQYSPATSWGTRIARMRFDSCGTSDPLPSLSINDVSVPEGNAGTTNATFTVSLSATSSGAVTVDYQTATDTATDSANVTTNVANSASIAIPDSGPATPYPSNITVPAGLGSLQKVTATLSGFTHTFPADVDVLLVGPGGQSVILMSDAGTGFNVNNLTFVFDDTGPALGTGMLASGTYRPTNIGSGDSWPSPAPAGPYGTALSVFNGIDPAGVWKLYVVDDFSVDTGNFSGGWSVSLTTPGQTADYTATSGTLAFAAGQTSKTIAVAINGDTTVEANETFFVNLTNPVLATIGDSQGVGTILDDDSGSFTDPVLNPRSTRVKVVHITELRTRINNVRAGCGLAAFSWTDSLTARVTVIKAVHVSELRTALNAAYTACGRTVPTYTDSTITARSTVVKAIHITELRNAVIALE